MNLGQPAILVPALTLLAAGAALLVWLVGFRKPKASAGGAQPSVNKAPDDESVQIEQLFRDADRQIKMALKGTTLASLPVVLVLGPKAAGKTSVIQNSGLAPELLAGQITQGQTLLPTRALNIWLAQKVIFVEISSTLAANSLALAAILKHLQPGRVRSAVKTNQPPRTVLLCVPQDSIQRSARIDSVLAESQSTSRILTAISGALGVQAPVYVLVTKIDCVQGFTEFAARLDISETRATLGATLRPFGPLERGAYAEEKTKIVEQNFTGLVCSLAEHRAWLLPREDDRARRALAYQFPREFEKLGTNLVPFLVESTKPSQLSASPFLRGFYFCGTRRLLLGRPNGPAPLSPAPSQAQLGATVVMSLEQLGVRASPLHSSKASNEMEAAEWLFLQSFFTHILLADRGAHAASAVSTRTDRFRAGALAIAGVLMLLVAATFTNSYARNRGLEKQLVRAVDRNGANESITDVIAGLERLREPIQDLLNYRSRTRWAIQFGLFQGDALLPPAQTIYCAELKQAALNRLGETISRRLPEFQSKTGDLSAEFRLLKTYLMISTRPDKADGTFLADELTNYSKDLFPTGSTSLLPMLAAQFRTYAELLLIPEARSSCLIKAVPGVIDSAKQALISLNADDRYQSLLRQAGRGAEPVNFNTLFPNDAVGDEHLIPGWFTRRGWANMQSLLQHPEQSLHTDAWVLNQSTDRSPRELADLADQYSKRYLNDYRQEWSKYLELAKVAPYSNMQDAVKKLDRMAASNSVLLNLIALAAENTSVSGEFSGAFQSTRAVAPSLDNFRPAAEYLSKLGMLKNRLARASESSGPAHDQDVQDVQNAATQANDAVDTISQLPSFKSENDDRLKALLRAPITQITPLLKKQSADEVNGAGKNLCAAYRPLSLKFPFSRASQEANWEEVEHLLGPAGALAQLENTYLQDSLDCVGGNCAPKVNPKYHVSPAFIGFATSLHAWKRLLYGEGPDSYINLALRAPQFNDLKRLDVVVDGAVVSLNPGKADSARLNWRPRPSQSFRVDGLFEGDTAPHRLFQSEGTWVAFRWLADAETNSGGRDGFLWRPRSGQFETQKRDNGKTMEYRIQIQSEGAYLDHRLFEPKACALPVSP